MLERTWWNSTAILFFKDFYQIWDRTLFPYQHLGMLISNYWFVGYLMAITQGIDVKVRVEKKDPHQHLSFNIANAIRFEKGIRSTG